MKSLVTLGVALLLVSAAELAVGQGLGRQYPNRRNDIGASYPSVSRARNSTITGTRLIDHTYLVTAKFIELNNEGTEVVLAQPQEQVAQGTRVSFSLNGYKSVLLGGGISISAPTVTVSVPGDEQDEQLQLGRYLHVKVTPSTDSQVRVDAEVEGRELEAVDRGIRVRNNHLRAIETIKVGDSLQLVLEKYEDGTPRSWLDLQVRMASGDLTTRNGRVLPGPTVNADTTPRTASQGTRYSTPAGVRPATRGPLK